MSQEASPENTTYMGHPPEETPKDVIKTIPEDHAHANSTQKKGITNATNINNTFIDKGEDKGKTYQSQYNPIEELTHDSEECKTKQDMVAQNTIQPNIANKTEGMTKTDNVLYDTKTINGNLQEHKIEQDITAENPIESNTATKTINDNLQEHKVKQDITAENPIESNTANTQNKTKRVVITGLNDPQRQISDLALQAQIFDEHYDIKTRCNVCRQCKRCSPLVAVRVKEKENIEKNEENIKIREFMKIVLTKEGKKKFVTRMPCEQSIIDEALEGSNRKDVIIANDKKLRQLTTIQQQELWEEFSKLVELGFIREVTTLSEESQQKLDTAVATYYIAVAPAFKSTSTSTKTRCAFDASMTNRSTKTSLNDILPVGFMGISLTATFRNFRLHPIGLASDLKKYYNSIEVHQDSFPVNRIVFRDNANPTGELKEYVLQNLFYGIRPAGSITDEALKFIAREAALKCEVCRPKIKCNTIDRDKSVQDQKVGATMILDTETVNKTNQDNQDEGYEEGTKVMVHEIDEHTFDPKCTEVNHEVYKLLSKKYVDDILASTFGYDRVNEIKKFTEKELNDYSFATKGWNITGDERTPGENNLNDDNKLGTCSYLWDPYTDTFKPKEVLLHNGPYAP